MGFSRQEYWSGLSLPSPGHLPDPGIEPVFIGRWILYHWATSKVLRLFPFFWRFLPKNILFSEALFSWHLGKGLSGECNWSINMRNQDISQALLFCENRRGEGGNLPSRWTQREKHVWLMNWNDTFLGMICADFLSPSYSIFQLLRQGLLNCGAGEDSWEFLEQQMDQTNQS